MTASSIEVLPATGSTIQPVRTITNSGVASGAHQQVISSADSNGFLKGEAGTSTLTSPTSIDATAAVVIALNLARRSVMIYNESGDTVYLAYSTTATTTAYTLQLPVGSIWVEDNGYTGPIWGITASGTTAVLRVTELTN